MAIVKLEWPTSGTPTVPTDYTYQNENLERAARGEGVTLSNWDDTTTAPQVSVGSTILSNGVYYYVTTSAETISTSGASAGTVYLILDDTAGSEEFVWTDTAPAWDAALNGWYVSGDRFTGHYCTWDGSSAYSVKSKYSTNSQDGDTSIIRSDGSIYSFDIECDTIDITDTDLWAGSEGSWSVSANDVMPAGAYMLVSTSSDVEIRTSSLWHKSSASSPNMNGVFVVSDGVNYRFGTSGTVYYRRIW